ncbi:hypothetical protein NQ315_010863 [Exocentrus adspersus]|uniref:Uncharacterized protein n=1 Tax=Exocentrus adspersus TaxID=1586481 RepID=A0AAV8VB42_9CUCU|nr:hypothetical protein NQ315_010863 [Exocentrus adspersus]
MTDPQLDIMELMNQRVEVLAVDLFGPLPQSEQGRRWILIVEDTASRWVELFALNEATAAYLTFGRELRTPQDVTHDLSAVIQNENFIAEITPRLQQLATTLQIAQENTEGMLIGIKRDRTLADARTHHIALVIKYGSGADSPVRRLPHSPRNSPPVEMDPIRRGPASYEVADTKTPEVPLGIYHAADITPFTGTPEDVQEPINRIRKRGRPKKSSLPSTLEPVDLTHPIPVARLHDYPVRSSTRLRNQRGRL